MPISRYPRPGFPLAPTLLGSVLNVSIFPGLLDRNETNFKKLADLDVRAWQVFSPEACDKLGNEIVNSVRVALPTFGDFILQAKLPAVPGIILENLELEQRTYNCLNQLRRKLKAKQDSNQFDLASLTIREVLMLKSFGAKSLVDLLTSLEFSCQAAVQVFVQESHADAEPPLPDSTLASIFIGRFKNLRLPDLTAANSLADLQLHIRTRNCLANHGFENRLAELSNLSLDQVLAIPDFGMQCLIDLLNATNRIKVGDRNAGNLVESCPARLSDYVDLQRKLGQALLGDQTPGSAPVAVEHYEYVEDEMRALILRCFSKKGTPSSARNANIAMAYFGCDGRGGLSLTEVARIQNLTKERVRQICLVTSQRLRKLTVGCPHFQSICKRIVELIPMDAETLEKLLKGEGLTRGLFRLEGIIQFSRLLGQTAPFELDNIDGQRMAVHANKTPIVRQAVALARKTVSQFGVATILDMSESLSHISSTSITPEFVTRVLEAYPGFEWLDRESGWFWLAHRRTNRVLSRIRKMLSVCDRINVGEMRTGIARHHEMNGYAPTRKVLIELCKRLAYCVVEGNEIRAEPPIDWKSTLQGTEFVMISLLKTHGPIMQRSQFENLCISNGMNRHTFYAYISYSSVIERYAMGVYGIRGANVEPGLVESLIPHNLRKTIVRLDHGWTPDRRIWIGYCLSEGMVSNGAFSVPGPMKEFLRGKYSLQTEDGAIVGTVAIKGHSGWGLGTLFRRRGGEAGDTLLLVFDSSKQVVVASIGDESLLDKFDVNHENGRVLQKELEFDEHAKRLT